MRSNAIKQVTCSLCGIGPLRMLYYFRYVGPQEEYSRHLNLVNIRALKRGVSPLYSRVGRPPHHHRKQPHQQTEKLPEPGKCTQFHHTQRRYKRIQSMNGTVRKRETSKSNGNRHTKQNETKRNTSPYNHDAREPDSRYSPGYSPPSQSCCPLANPHLHPPTNNNASFPRPNPPARSRRREKHLASVSADSGNLTASKAGAASRVEKRRDREASTEQSRKH